MFVSRCRKIDPAGSKIYLHKPKIEIDVSEIEIDCVQDRVANKYLCCFMDIQACARALSTTYR